MFRKSKTLWAIVLCPVLLAGCNMDHNMKKDGYIGKADIRPADGRMTPEVLLSLGRLSDPQLSPDSTKILYGVSYTSIQENRSCRNLFFCRTDGTGATQLTFDGKDIRNARWSADGRRIYFLQDGQIWAAVFMGVKEGQYRLGERNRVTAVPAGISGFTLSPDSRKVLYTSTVPGRVTTPKDSDPALDKARAYVTEDLMYRHWDHWTTELPHTYVAPWPEDEIRKENRTGVRITPENSTDLLGGPEVKFELPAEPFGGLEQLSWSPDSRRIAYSCKKLCGKEYAFSTDAEIYIFDTETGETLQIPMHGGYDTEPVWSPDGSRLVWLSMARNGYEADKSRLMLADFSDGKVSPARDLTAGFDGDAAGPVWSADSKSIYFNALIDGLQVLFRADIKESCDTAMPAGGKTEAEGSLQAPAVAEAETAVIERLTRDDLWYDFNSPFAVLGDGTLLTSYCSMDFPNELVAVRPDRSLRQLTQENTDLLARLERHETELRTIPTTDGKKMRTWVLYPPEFDRNRVYPAIEILLGGPQGTLSQSWSYRWNYLLMCHQGYVVILPNRRGTTAFGRKWTEQISGDYIGLNMQDYLQAGRVMKKEPYIGRLAGCGASYGGYSAYYLAGVHEQLYDCFIAHAGIFDEAYMYYETEELWFPNWDNGGLAEYAYTPGQTGPAGDGETFGGMRQGGSPWSAKPKALRHYGHSPAANVTAWQTPILCIHGGQDFRIPYDQGMAAFNCAQLMGVPSKLIVFPDENHWILKPQNALFWHRSYFEWLDRWCKP